MITIEDCIDEIKEQNLRLMVENDESIFDIARRKAIGRVKASLRKRYNIDLVFAQTGENRDDFLVELLVAITVYRIYPRAANGVNASKAREDYHNALIDLERIENGEKDLGLPRAPSEVDPNTGAAPSVNYGGEEYDSNNDLR